jgi:hypothetical protein
MNDRPSLEENYKRAIAPVLARVGEPQWEKARVTSIGGAGLSTAVLFLLTQVKLESTSLTVAFFCAALAIPVCLALWQVGEAYSLYGTAAHGHFAQPQGSGLGAVLFVLGGVLLLVSFVTLIWHFSVAASCGFVVVALLMIVVVYKHQAAVRRWAEKDPGDAA